MGFSFYEIYTTSQRAFRGMGFPFGADEDAAYIIAWLELNNLNGVNILKNILDKIDGQYDGVLNIKKANKNIDLKNKSILMKGPGLIDFIISNIDKNQKISVNVFNYTNSILFLPLLYKANKHIKYAELIYKDSHNRRNIFKIYQNKIFHNIKENNNNNNNELKITLSNEKELDKINDKNRELINENKIQKNLLQSITPRDNDWKKISNIANRTFVPESEESRNKGAGGGDAND